MNERKEIHMPATEKAYEQFGIVEAVRVGERVYVSGQVGWDQNLRPASGLEAQARLAFQNLSAVLQKAGAKPQHVTHLQLFFADTDQSISLMEKIDVVCKVRKEVMPECRAAGTAVRVLELAHPKLMLEVQATAEVS
jgi:enamine deaminase RidA (YjgF/YER057c/UK114 family)